MNTLGNTSKLVITLVMAVGFWFPSAAWAVSLVPSWSIAGPGTTSAVQNTPSDWDLSYSLNPAGFSTVTWTVTSAALLDSGDYEFDWHYSGFHAFFQVRAFLKASDGTTLYSAGPINCCTSPSAGFNQFGNYTFSGVSAGQTIGFTMGGSNFDSNNQLNGTLNLNQVPEPTTAALLGLGLVGLGLWGRKRKEETN